VLQSITAALKAVLTSLHSRPCSQWQTAAALKAVLGVTAVALKAVLTSLHSNLLRVTAAALKAVLQLTATTLNAVL
jgi:hypothetical protein